MSQCFALCEALRLVLEVGAGLGDFAGKIWRVGLMGESSNVNHVNVLLAALREMLG